MRERKVEWAKVSLLAIVRLLFLQTTCVEKDKDSNKDSINYDCLFRYLRSAILSILLFTIGVVLEMIILTTLRKTRVFLYVFAIFTVLLQISLHEYELKNAKDAAAIYVIQADDALFESGCTKKMMLTYSNNAVMVISLGGHDEESNKEISYTLEEVIGALRSSATEKLAKRGYFLLVSLYDFTAEKLMADLHKRQKAMGGDKKSKLADYSRNHSDILSSGSATKKILNILKNKPIVRATGVKVVAEKDNHKQQQATTTAAQ